MLIPAVSDIIKILEKLPEWTRLTKLLGRVDTLEKRVTELEAQLKKPLVAGPVCAICREPMKVIKVEPDPIFGDLGQQQHTLECPNGHVEHRLVNPNGG